MFLSGYAFNGAAPERPKKPTRTGSAGSPLHKSQNRQHSRVESIDFGSSSFSAIAYGCKVSLAVATAPVGGQFMFKRRSISSNKPLQWRSQP
jgi:hypothetical protein